MSLTQATLDFYGRTVCMPVALLVNFSLSQYLATTYFRRRRERRVILLLCCSVGSFACLIPMAHPSDTVVNELNDISEILSTMTFLIQITMIGHDMNRKMRVRSLIWCAFAAELLTALGILLAIKLLIELAAPQLDLHRFDVADNIMEDVSLVFVLFFRVFYIAQIRGLRAALTDKKYEIALYLLFVTHEYPFMILKAATGLEWEEVQAVWHRLTMAACIVHTVRQKIKQSSSIRGANSSRFAVTTSIEAPKPENMSNLRTQSSTQLRSRAASGRLQLTSVNSVRAVVPARKNSNVGRSLVAPTPLS